MGSTSATAIDPSEVWEYNTLDKAQSFLSSRDTIFSLQNFVAGQFITSSSPPTQHIKSFEPKTGRLIYTLPCTSPNEVEEAIQHAKAAFPSWSKTSRAERSALLRRVSDLLQEHRELLAVWESIDQGKTLERARIEVDRAVSNFS